MTVNFPSTSGKPTDGSFKYVYNGIVYSWDGQKWTGEVTDNGSSERVGTLQEVTDLGNTTTNGITSAGELLSQSAAFNYKQGKTGQVFGVYEGLSTDNAAKIAFNNDGSITAAGIVDVGDTVNGANGYFRARPEGTVYIRPADSASSSSTALMVLSGSDSAATTTITKDGSISAVGEILSGDALRAGTYAVLESSGIIESVPASDSSRAFSIWSRDQSKRTVEINAGGNITAKSLEIEGNGRQLDESPLIINNTNGDGYNICSQDNGTGTFSLTADGTAFLGPNSSPNISLIGSSGRINAKEINTYGTAGFIANHDGNGEAYAWRGVNDSGTNTSYFDYNGNATFTGTVQASNISNFKTKLKTAITSATDLASVKTAILDALEDLVPSEYGGN